MLSEPAVWDALMAKLADDLLRVRPREGRRRRGRDPALRLVGRRARPVALPRARRARGAPGSSRRSTSRRSTSAPAPSTCVDQIAPAGGDVIGVDWRHAARRGAEPSCPGRAVQGNLEPAALLAPWEVVEREALDVLDRADGLATSSTSATASCPGPIRTSSPGSRPSCGSGRHRCLSRPRPQDGVSFAPPRGRAADGAGDATGRLRREHGRPRRPHEAAAVAKADATSLSSPQGRPARRSTSSWSTRPGAQGLCDARGDGHGDGPRRSSTGSSSTRRTVAGARTGCDAADRGAGP